MWLALAVLMPPVTIATAVRDQAKGMPRRRLWTVAALVGSPAFVLNWTTGEAGFANNFFVLFGAAIQRPGAAAPWLLTVAIPIGALVAYVRLRAWQNAQAVRATAGSRRSVPTNKPTPGVSRRPDDLR